MDIVLRYERYFGNVEFSEGDGLFYGKIQHVRSLISYEGRTEQELLLDSQKTVDNYLTLCKAEGLSPETAS